MNKLKIANGYGNVDVREPLSKSYVHIKGERLQPLCRKMGIKYAPALVGFNQRYRKYPAKPILNGVVVSRKVMDRLIQAIGERTIRSANRKPRPHKPTTDERVMEAGFISRSLVGQAYIQGDITKEEADFISFIAEYRHEHTNYEALLEEYSGNDFAKSDARHDKEDITPIPDNWTDYLHTYGFQSDEAQALANILKTPLDAHPVWFMEAECAIRHCKTPLEGLTYERVVSAIEVFRDFRHRDD